MQIAVHMVKYTDEFMGMLDKFLEQKNLGFIDYVFSVVHGEIWGDEYMIAAISHMWNISISMISSGYSSLIQLSSHEFRNCISETPKCQSISQIW